MGYLDICFCFRNLTKSMLRKSSSCFGRSRKCYSKGKWAPRPIIFWPNAASGQEDPSISGMDMATNSCRDGGLISAQFRLFSQHSVTELFLWNTVLSWQVTPFITGPKETLTTAGSRAFNLAEANLGYSQKDVLSMAGARVRGGPFISTFSLCEWQASVITEPMSAGEGKCVVMVMLQRPGDHLLRTGLAVLFLLSLFSSYQGDIYYDFL